MKILTIFAQHDRLEECFVNVYLEEWRISPYGIRWNERENAVGSRMADSPGYRIHVIPKMGGDRP